MEKSDKSTESEMIACEICLKEVPHSETENEEVGDYVVHFCGLECYEKWHEETAEKK